MANQLYDVRQFSLMFNVTSDNVSSVSFLVETPLVETSEGQFMEQ